MPQSADRRRQPDVKPEGFAVMKKFDWERQLHALPLDRGIKDVGFALARFASQNGRNAHPGVYRIMWASGIKDERTVHKGLAELRRHGLIWLHQAGSGRPRQGKEPRADHYWLTTHAAVQGRLTDYDTWLKQRAPRKLPASGAGFSPSENAA